VDKMDTLLEIMTAMKSLLLSLLSSLTSTQIDSIIGMEDAGVTATVATMICIDYFFCYVAIM